MKVGEDTIWESDQNNKTSNVIHAKINNEDIKHQSRSNLLK